MTIEDILDTLIIDNLELKVWEESTQEERDYDEDRDLNAEINSFEFSHRKSGDFVVFNID